MTEHTRLIHFVETAILAAILLILSFTPLGYAIKIGVVEITILMLPVAVGAIVISPAAGAVLGLIFGLTSFWTCLSGSSVFGGQLLQVSAVSTFVTCVVPRVLAGLLCGIIARAIKNKTLSCVIASLSASALNTILFTGTLLALFSKSDYLTGMIGGKNLLVFAALFVGANGFIEILVITLLGSVITRALIKSGVVK